MKYLCFLLLYFGLCNAQDHHKVTAYRIVVDYEDGPCSIVSYMKSDEFGSVFTAESGDITMIENLLSLKKKAEKSDKTEFWCRSGYIGGDMIDNMFVFEGHKDNDTLFISNYDHLIVFPNEQKAYKDEGLAVYKALNKHFKAFFNRDFNSEYTERILMGTRVLDSTRVEKIMYKGKVITKSNFKDIITHTQSLKEIDLIKSVNDSVQDYYYKYEADRDIIETKNNKSIESVIINNPDTFSIGDIKVGDNEELVAITYPRSAKHTYPDSKKFEEMGYKYNYEIILENNKGDAIISIDKKTVRSIKITLR